MPTNLRIKSLLPRDSLTCSFAGIRLLTSQNHCSLFLFVSRYFLLPLEDEELEAEFPDAIWDRCRIVDGILRCEFRLRMPRPNGFNIEVRGGARLHPVHEIYVDYRLSFTEESLEYRGGHEYMSDDGTSYAYLEASHPLLPDFVLVGQTGGSPRVSRPDLAAYMNRSARSQSLSACQ